jgi:enoyl-CoA hydratase/carnithine racemase
MDEGLSVSIEKGVARLRLTRPEKRNSLTRSVCALLHAALTAAADDPMCRAVVIEGSGGSFASGADLKDLERLRGSRPLLLAMYRELRATQELLYAMDRPTIAAIDGYCFGAGLSLALACDLRLASSRSIFSAPPARLGLIYSDREVWRLALRIGTARARDLLFTGRRVEAVEALQLGLIERMTDAGGFAAALDEMLGQLASCSQNSLRKTKEQLLRLEREGPRGIAGDGPAEDAFFEPDAAEGMAAFLGRRAPRFS